MLYTIACALAFIAMARSALIGGDGMDLVATPHGYRPSKCVIRHDSYDVHLTETPEGTHAFYADVNEHHFFPRDQDCVDNARALFGVNGTRTRLTNLQAWDVDSSYTPPSNMGVFNSTYVLPDETIANTGQLLYFFIGFQNNDGSGEGLTIVQPVVNYQHSAWQTEPWNCCPSGQSNTGKAIRLVSGATTQNWVVADHTNTAIGSSYNGQPTQLSVTTHGRNFDWCCVTLEQYGASACTSYNAKAFVFKDIVLVTQSGTALTARWSTGRGACNGGSTVVSPQEVDIYGRDKP
jgi:hypothetical protein